MLNVTRVLYCFPANGKLAYQGKVDHPNQKQLCWLVSICNVGTLQMWSEMCAHDCLGVGLSLVHQNAKHKHNRQKCSPDLRLDLSLQLLVEAKRAFVWECHCSLLSIILVYVCHKLSIHAIAE